MRAVSFMVLAITACAGCAGKTGPHPRAIQHLGAGIAYLQSGECELAEERCRLALEYGEKFAEGHNCLGAIALHCDNDPARAAEHFKAALAIDEDFAQAHNNLGTCFMRKIPADYEPACEEYNAALEIDPEYVDARENLGVCLVRRGELGDAEARHELFRRARSQLIRLLEIAPLRARAHAHLGLMELIEGHPEAASRRFMRCLEIEPNNATCHYNLGNAQLAQALCGPAIMSFISALRTEGEVSVPARQNLAVAYEMCAKQDGAFAIFLERIKTDPANPLHHFDLGRIYAEKGLIYEAAVEWRNTLMLDSGYCPAYWELAMRAHAELDSRATEELCRSYVACSQGKEPEEKVERCRVLATELTAGKPE